MKWTTKTVEVRIDPMGVWGLSIREEVINGKGEQYVSLCRTQKITLETRGEHRKDFSYFFPPTGNH